MARQQFRLCLLAFLVATFAIIASNTAKLIQVHRADCINQPYRYSSHVRCGIRTFRNQSQRLIGELTLDAPVRQLFGAFHVYTKHAASQTHLYGTTVELCPLLEGSEPSVPVLPALQHEQSILTDIVRERILRNFPHLMHPCPYEGTVNLTGTAIRMDLVPPHLLPGQYVVNLRLFDAANETIAHARVLFSLSESA